jgi:hypothetical protein
MNQLLMGPPKRPTNIPAEKPKQIKNQSDRLKVIESAKREFETIKSERITPIEQGLKLDAANLFQTLYQSLGPGEQIPRKAQQLFDQLGLGNKLGNNLLTVEVDPALLDNSDLITPLETNSYDLRSLTLVELFNQESVRLQNLSYRINHCFELIISSLSGSQKIDFSTRNKSFFTSTRFIKMTAEQNQTRFAHFRDEYSQVSRGFSRISSNILPYLDGFKVESSFDFGDQSFSNIEIGFETEIEVSKYLSKEPTVIFAISTPMCSKADTKYGINADLITFEKNKPLTTDQEAQLELLVEQVGYYSYYFSLIKSYDASKGEDLFENFKKNMRVKKSKHLFEKAAKDAKDIGEPKDHSFLDNPVKGENLARHYPIALAPNNQVFKFKKGRKMKFSVEEQYISEEAGFLADPDSFEKRISQLRAQLRNLIFELDITARRVQIKTNINTARSNEDMAAKKYPGIIGPIPEKLNSNVSQMASIALGKASPEVLFVNPLP